MSSLPACPICGRDQYMKSPKPLYRHQVCKKCANGFANRRQFAWLIDMFILRLFILGVSFGIGFILSQAILSSRGEITDADLESFQMIDLAFVFIGMFVLSIKDGFGGRSIGKLITGVQVMHETTGRPIDLWTSIKRNWVTLIPFVPLVCGIQLIKGKRWGDGLAKTKVIWNRYAHSVVFRVGPGHLDDADSLDSIPIPAYRPDEAINPYRPNL